MTTPGTSSIETDKGSPTRSQPVVLEERASETTDGLARLRLWLGFAKFVLGTVAVGVLSAVLNQQIQSRTLAMKEVEQQQEYVKQFVVQALDDNLEKRVRFAHYFSSLLGGTWKAYYDGVHDQYVAQVRELAKVRAEAEKLANAPNEKGFEQLPVLQKRIEDLESNITRPRTTDLESPIGPRPLTELQRRGQFGTFGFEAKPTPENPEAIAIDEAWVKENIVTIAVPQLAGIKGAPEGLEVRVHRKAAAAVLALWKAWEERGILKDVVSWDGAYSPRFIRGSRTMLSASAFGTSFRINTKENAARMPAEGDKGSTRRLAKVAIELGFAWGGNFARADGSFFEYTGA